MSSFEFNEANFRSPSLPPDLKIHPVPLELATPLSLKGLGHLISSPDEITTEKGNFEITPWPTLGWRKLDPGTGDEAGKFACILHSSVATSVPISIP